MRKETLGSSFKWTSGYKNLLVSYAPPYMTPAAKRTKRRFWGPLWHKV